MTIDLVPGVAEENEDGFAVEDLGCEDQRIAAWILLALMGTEGHGSAGLY